MDVTSFRRLSGLAGLVLAIVSRAGLAAEAYVADGAPTTLMVTATDADPAPSLPPASKAADLIVRGDNGAAPSSKPQSELRALTADGAAAATAAPAAAQGTLTVVANAARPAAPLVMANDPAVQPAASLQALQSIQRHGGGITGSQPQDRRSAVRTGKPLIERFSIMEGSKPRSSSNNPRAESRRAIPQHAAAAPRRASAPTAQRPQHVQTAPANQGVRTAELQEPVAGTPAKSNQREPQADTPPALLAKAHKLSLTAASQGAYSQVIKLCADAKLHGLEGESLAYSNQLSAWALNRRGQIRADEGLGELAMADFRAAVEAEPDNWRALHNRGVTYAQNGQFAEAFDDVCRVIELNPKYAKAYSNRATLYVQANDFANAMADYDQALTLDPKLTPALVGRGRVRHMQGRLAEALVDLTAATAESPKDAEIICSRADLLADLGRYNDALTDYARAIERNPRFEHAFRNGAWLLATCPDDSVRDAEGALDGAQAALKCGYGERHAALDTMAAALANAGKFQEALATIQQAIDIAPEDLRPAYVARQELYKAGQPFRTKPVGEVRTAGFEEK